MSAALTVNPKERDLLRMIRKLEERIKALEARVTTLETP